MTSPSGSRSGSQPPPLAPEAATSRVTAPGGSPDVGIPGIPTGRPWAEALGRWAVVLATGFVAVTAFVLAYDGSRGAALDAGISAAGWYPFCIEGVIVCASVATMTLTGLRYPWVILLLFSAVSIAANVLHAGQHPGAHWWSLVFAAVPPATLPICVHLVLMVVRPAAHRAQRAAGEPHLGEPCEPGVGLTSERGSPPASWVESPRESPTEPDWRAVESPSLASPPSPGSASEPDSEPGSLGSVSPIRRQRASAVSPGEPALLHCDCGLDRCPGRVSKAARTRHRKEVSDARELAERATQNGHREPISAQ